MRKIVSILFIAVFSIIFILGVSGSIDLFQFKDNISEEAVSRAYIDKDVTGPNEEVEFGVSEDLETGSANMVTSIIVNYRSFDTLGEVTVLFIAAIGVSMLLGSSKIFMKNGKSGFILRKAAGFLFPVILITGIYMFTHGHLTPGGGFPGGSIIASAFLLMYLANDDFRVRMNRFKIAEGLAGTLYIIIGLAGLIAAGYFLKDFISTGIVGNLISAGIIPIVYIIIGLKVGSEVTGILSDFFKEEVGS